MLSFALLVSAVAGAIARPFRAPAWTAPTVAVAVALILPLTPHPWSVLGELRAPIAFLLCAVPLTILLDKVGFFSAAAGLVGQNRHLVLGLWVFGAFVTTVLNLDAAVVLLTPLYVRIARRSGIDPFTLAVQPVLLSCLVVGPSIGVPGAVAGRHGGDGPPVRLGRCDDHGSVTGRSVGGPARSATHRGLVSPTAPTPPPRLRHDWPRRHGAVSIRPCRSLVQPSLVRPSLV